MLPSNCLGFSAGGLVRTKTRADEVGFGEKEIKTVVLELLPVDGGELDSVEVSDCLEVSVSSRLDENVNCFKVAELMSSACAVAAVIYELLEDIETASVLSFRV